MSETTTGVPLMMRVKWLAIGVVAGAALVYGLRPPVSAVAMPARVATESPTTKPAVPSAQSSAKTPTAELSVDDAGAAPVAIIDGNPITLREVEDTLLKKEGVQELMNMLDDQLKRTNWEALRDRDIIVQINSWPVSRLTVAAILLKQKADSAREDLIGITLVQNALKKEGVVIDDALIANELKRMEKRHIEAQEARKQTYVEFRTMIEQTEKMPLEQYVHQAGFRMGAGIRVLVERRAKAQLDESQLQEWFAKHIDQYRIQPAVDVSDIYIPFQRAKGPDGKDLPATPEERDNKMGVMIGFHQAIFKRTSTFESIFRAFGKAYDQQADADGRLGWVSRDGGRPIKGSRRLAKAVMDEAFAAQPPYPVMLSPVTSEAGIDLIKVHERRAGREPVFAEIKEQLIRDIVDSELVPRTKSVLTEIRKSAKVEYVSLPSLLERRLNAAGLPSAKANEPVSP